MTRETIAPATTRLSLTFAPLEGYDKRWQLTTLSRNWGRTSGRSPKRVRPYSSKAAAIAAFPPNSAAQQQLKSTAGMRLACGPMPLSARRRAVAGYSPAMFADVRQTRTEPREWMAVQGKARAESEPIAAGSNRTHWRRVEAGWVPADGLTVLAPNPHPRPSPGTSGEGERPLTRGCAKRTQRGQAIRCASWIGIRSCCREPALAQDSLTRYTRLSSIL
jgi:hypothetical protein